MLCFRENKFYFDCKNVPGTPDYEILYGILNIYRKHKMWFNITASN